MDIRVPTARRESEDCHKSSCPRPPRISSYFWGVHLHKGQGDRQVVNELEEVNAKPCDWNASWGRYEFLGRSSAVDFNSRASLQWAPCHADLVKADITWASHDSRPAKKEPNDRLWPSFWLGLSGALPLHGAVQNKVPRVSRVIYTPSAANPSNFYSTVDTWSSLYAVANCIYVSLFRMYSQTLIYVLLYIHTFDLHTFFFFLRITLNMYSNLIYVLCLTYSKYVNWFQVR